MANDKSGNEPQSYGSDAEWVTGKTGQQVNNPKAAPPNSQHGDFYESRHDSGESGPEQGGKLSGVDGDSGTQVDACLIEPDAEQPGKKVATAEGGAVRDSFFKERDYE
jgi:hypothetical protein